MSAPKPANWRDLISAAVHVYDCSPASALASFESSDWFICPRVAATLRRWASYRRIA